jgi:hypothetical protein
MQIKVIAALILLAGAAAALHAQPAPNGPMPSATPALVKLAQQKAHEAAIANCEALWDRGTHMTKTEWSRACRRVQDRLAQLDLR